MNDKVSRLSEPLRLGNIIAKNRIWLSPMETNTASITGEVTDAVIAHYASRAKGGAGLITQEFTAVDFKHHVNPVQLCIDHDIYKVGLSRLVNEVHKYGTPIICQLHHAGMFCIDDPVSPSGVAVYDLGKGHYIQPRALSVEEIEETRDKFIAAAVRAMEAGYDGVELHGATAYLLAQFFSAYNNRRTDKYGGSVVGRMQLALEIVKGIREKCGPDYVLGYTMVDKDFEHGGSTREENIMFAKALEEAGITYLDFQSNGTYETFHFEECSSGFRRQPQGMFETTKVYKQFLRIPVTTRSSGLYNPLAWNEAIENGDADAVRVGKPHLAEPELVGKVLSGRFEDIRPCIKCLNCLDSAVVNHLSITCTVNSGLGRCEVPVAPAPVSKKVLVIGGGPGGLEAARVSALRGHSVTLFEKEDHLGGNLYIGSLPTAKEDLNLFTNWQEKQCKKLGVDIRLNTAATVEMVKEFNPDVVFVSTGSNPIIPRIPGVDQKNVVLAADVLLGKASVGKKVIVAGGGEVGAETAEFLLYKDLADEVTIVEMMPELGKDMGNIDKGLLFGNQFPKYMPNRLKLALGTKIEAITKKGVAVSDKNWNKFEIEADTVVLALGYSSDRSLAKDLADVTPEVYVIGDAVRPRKILNAVHEADNYARNI